MARGALPAKPERLSGPLTAVLEDLHVAVLSAGGREIQGDQIQGLRPARLRFSPFPLRRQALAESSEPKNQLPAVACALENMKFGRDGGRPLPGRTPSAERLSKEPCPVSPLQESPKGGQEGGPAAAAEVETQRDQVLLRLSRHQQSGDPPVQPHALPPPTAASSPELGRAAASAKSSELPDRTYSRKASRDTLEGHSWPNFLR